MSKELNSRKVQKYQAMIGVSGMRTRKSAYIFARKHRGLTMNYIGRLRLIRGGKRRKPNEE